MPSLRQQIREYFDARALPAERVEAILRSGEEAAAGNEPRKIIPWQRWPSVLAMAAAVTVFAGLVFWIVPAQPEPAPFAALAPRVVEFFGAEPHLPKLSQDKAALHEWLVAKGAPADFVVPARLAALESFGCSVVDVKGHPAYLTCFWRKKNPDGTGGELIHLLAVRRTDFRDTPAGHEPQTRQINGWSFASWSEGDVTYTLAAAAPPEKVREFLSLAPAVSSVAPRIAAISF